MNPMDLKEATVTDLELFANPSDLRQDLHVFMDYALSHEIKRGHRDNRIPQAHQQRLAKLMSAPAHAAQADEWGGLRWVEHVDGVCFDLQWISYDIKGVYAGYTSAEPSYPDNYIKTNQTQYERFLRLSLQEQEDQILQAHVKDYNHSNNEFFRRGTLSRLDQFCSTGCATGVVPSIPFDKVRRCLLEVLARCPSAVWFTTASLIEYLQKNDPWFLIPKNIASLVTKGSLRQGRYSNFIECKRGDYGNSDGLPDHDPEGFAKVEGRYIERFLEGIPLVLGYTEVAYVRRKTETAIEPSRGLLKAFRVTERLVRALRKEVAEPKVTVLPNFEVHVESLFYPARTEQQLQTLGELTQRGIVTVFKLKKPQVAAFMASHPKRGASDLLQDLSGRELPVNVAQELTDWAGHSEKFILYEGLGVLEGPRAEAAGVDPFVVEAISPHFTLIRSTEKLYQHLDVTEQIPVRIRHPDDTLRAPAHVSSRLAPKAAPPPAPIKKPVKLKCSVQTTLWFADPEAHAAFCQILLDAKCVVPTDKRALTVTYSRKAEPQIRECLTKLKQTYAVSIEDIDT